MGTQSEGSDPRDLERIDGRFELLSEANALLLSTHEPEAVVRIIGERVLRHLGADVFFNYVLDPGAERLRLNACGGVDDRVAKMIERLELGQAICGCVARDGERIISDDVQNNGDPRADLVRRMGVRSYVCHPLRSGDRTIGTLSFGTKIKDAFAPDEIELMRTVATQVSIAMERERAQTELRRAAQEQETLRELAEVGASSMTEIEAAQRILDAVTARLGCGTGALLGLDRDEASLRPLASVGTGEDGLQRYVAALGGEGSALTVSAIASRTPRYVRDTEDRSIVESTRALGRDLGVRAAFAAPLVMRDTVIGTIALGWPEPRALDDRGLSFLESIASEAAIGLSNARLAESERERGRLRQSMLEIHAALLSSLDVDEALPRVMSELVSALHGIGGTINERVPGGWRMRAAEGTTSAILRPGKVFRDSDAPALMQILATRAPLIVEDVTKTETLNTRLVKRTGIRAYATYPLMLRGEVTGAVTIQFGDSHAFTEDELEYMRRVAFAVSLSEENSRLYKAEQALADRLQGALLALPDHVPGIEFARAYHSATEAARVGGDFYDVFELDKDRIGIVIGDVAGHGIDAAVLTSMVKHTIRAHANEAGKTPSRILELTNDVMYKATSTETFVTVFLALLDRRDGTFVYANAGHPAGAIAARGGEVRSLPATGPVLGAVSALPFGESASRLGEGELLFLYTDGLTEARTDGQLYGERRLFDLLSTSAGGSPTEVVSRAVEAAVAFANFQLRDDLAILAVRCTGLTR